MPESFTRTSRAARLRPSTSSSHLNLPDYVRENDYEKLPRAPLAAADAEQRKTSQSTVVERGYDEGQAVTEASRCLDCGVNTIFRFREVHFVRRLCGHLPGAVPAIGLVRTAKRG